MPSLTPPPLEDFRLLSVTNRRTITFSQADDKFYINGKMFDRDREDVIVRIGDVEEWTIENPTDEWHVWSTCVGHRSYSRFRCFTFTRLNFKSFSRAKNALTLCSIWTQLTYLPGTLPAGRQGRSRSGSPISVLN